MITVETIKGKMDEHILGAIEHDVSPRDRCAKLGVDDEAIVQFFARRYGSLAPSLLGYIVVGIEIGMEAVASREPEPSESRDEFLASIEPDHDPEGT